MMESHSGTNPDSQPRFDFAIHDRKGQTKALVQVKARLGTTRGWAAKYWLKLDALGQRPNADYFLLVTPEKLYVWKIARAKTEGTPTRVLDTSVVLNSYFKRLGTGPEGIKPLAFNMLVGAWLDDLTTAASPGTENEELARTGLLRAIAGGAIREEPV
ncbi:hypothetical protein HJC10_13080 [Corallococcus exiguus]|uniref:hypothetical protein n=1 Tax=Corallococcus TaxID=83461 RepID=UPI000EA38D03|nr:MULTISPECIES: hypothetical protein [Corallococcus]NNB87740.1 hypothetical protein [Corallococcus exiguus]NNB95587.1 hypothetical protein [Corallococcus exiguus]NNC03775.1 hypothetical protein [Corallococcus exiguus]NNC16816.1 hypothetical protein [Corallococcus exiguus]NPC47655.1 hypothetical protein [Corallococcus exiguus]